MAPTNSYLLEISLWLQNVIYSAKQQQADNSKQTLTDYRDFAILEIEVKKRKTQFTHLLN